MRLTALFVRLEDLALTIAAEDLVYMPSQVAARAGHLPLPSLRE
ncbi:hypothetical protein [Bradyrhizobium sp. USDA 3458]|nr:hypothetical protein [Bradyrhizobium sp. USDA 3458]